MTKEWFLYVRGYPEFRIDACTATAARNAKKEFKKLHGLKIMPPGALLTDQRREMNKNLRHPTLDPDDDHSERESLDEAWRFQDDMEQLLYGEGGPLDPSPPVQPDLKKWTGSPSFHLAKD